MHQARPPRFIKGEPPETGRRYYTSQRSSLIEALKARPGEWAIVYMAPNRDAAKGRSYQLELRGCDATVRGSVVYARWPRAA